MTPALAVALLGHASSRERFTYGYGLARVRAYAEAAGAPGHITHHDRRDDDDEVEDLALLLADSPDVVGLSAFMWSFERVSRLVDRLRRELPRALILVGGPSALAYRTASPELARPDYLVVGEGERPFAALLEARAAGELDRRWSDISGLTPGDQPDLLPVDAPPLDQLPSPYLTGLIKPAGNTIYLETSRGCPHRCGFCIASTRPRGVRYFPREQVAAELRWALERGHPAVNLCDAAINYDSDRLAELIATVNRVDPDGRLGFGFALHADYLDDHQVELLSRLPIDQATVGLNSLTPATFAAAGRKIDPARFAAAIEKLASITRPVVSLVLGLPGETVAGFAQTLDFCSRLAADIEIFELKVIPETSYFERAPELDLVFEPGCEMTVQRSQSFDAAELDEMRALAATFQSERGRFRNQQLVGPHAHLTGGPIGEIRRALAALGAFTGDGSRLTVGDFELTGIDAERTHGAVSLDFARPTGERVTVQISPRRDDQPSLVQSRSFNLGYAVDPTRPPSTDAIAIVRELARRLD